MSLLRRCSWFAGWTCGALLMFVAQPPAASASVDSVSCGSAGNCSAVGSYYDLSVLTQGLLLTETSGTWAPGTDAALPPNACSSGGCRTDLDSVSCASAGNCTAVGDNGDFANHDPRDYSEGLMVTETSGTWSAGVEATLPANAAVTNQFVGLNSVSCATAGNCSAVGYYYDSSGRQQGLLLTETAGAWVPGVEATLPTNAGSSSRAGLSTVSCASAGNCTAVGYYYDNSGHQQGLLLTESSGAWAPGIELSLPTTAGSDPRADVSSVSCATVGNCSAVGSYLDSSGSRQGVVLSETSGVWETGVEAGLPANAGSNHDLVLGSVSCASAGNCSAVGYYSDSSTHEHGLLLTETSGVWASGVEASPPANAGPNPDSSLSSVSCASVGNCTAVGSYVGGSGVQGLIVSETGDVWAPGVEAALPANADANPGASLDSVSCASASSCSAVGGYTDCAANQLGLLLTETGGTWAPGVEAPLPATAVLSSCPVALSRLRVSPKRFELSGRRVNGRCVKRTANNYTHRHCIRPIKLTVSYTLGSPATVTVTLKRLAQGRRVDGRLLRVPGKITVTDAAGANSFTFHGRMGGKTLGPGSYRLTATTKANGQAGTSRTIAFKIAA